MTFPAGVDFGKVTFTSLLAYADDADADGTPESIPDTGQVTFALTASALLAADATAPVTIVSTRLQYAIDIDGILRDKQGNPWVQLIATDSPSIRVPVGQDQTPTDPEWNWIASFDLANGKRDPIPFELPAGQVVDLTSVTPLEVSYGVQTIMGPQGAPGKSAYQTWLDAGHTGTDDDFLTWLKGPQGDPGSGNVDSVNGDPGPDITLTADNIGDGATHVTMTSAERTKLTGVAAGATAVNGIADVTGLQTALDAKLEQSDVEGVADARIGNALLVIQYDDVANSWHSQVRPATTRPVVWVYPNDITAVPNTGTTAGGTLQAVDNTDFHAKYTRT